MDVVKFWQGNFYDRKSFADGPRSGNAPRKVAASPGHRATSTIARAQRSPSTAAPLLIAMMWARIVDITRLCKAYVKVFILSLWLESFTIYLGEAWFAKLGLNRLQRSVANR